MARYKFNEVAFSCPYCKSEFESCPPLPSTYRQSIRYGCGTIINYVKLGSDLFCQPDDVSRTIKCRIIEDVSHQDDDII